MRQFRLFFVSLIALLFAGAAVAQEPTPAPEPEPFVKFNVELAAGGGFSFGNEDQAFDGDSLYATVHANAVEFDLFDATSGLGLELNFSGPDTVRWSLWSLNRVDVPGVKNVYVGADAKIAQNDGDGYSANFDARISTGYRFGRIGPGDVRMEVYAIEEDKPIRVAFLYGWK